MTEDPSSRARNLPLIQKQLAGRVWELSWLSGMPILAADRPRIRISRGGYLIGAHGFTCIKGCVATHKDRIAISISASRPLLKAPEDRELDIFLRVLRAAKTYLVPGDSLSLFDALGGALARFSERLPS